MIESNQDLVIVKLDLAKQTLAEAKTIQQTKQFIDGAGEAEKLAKQQRLGKDAIEHAHAIKLEALRRLGELLKAMPKAKGGQPYQKKNSTGSKSEPVATLSALGIDKKVSMIAQQLADLPQALFEQVRDGTMTFAKALQAKDGNTNKAWSLESAEQRLRNSINAEITGAGSQPVVKDLLQKLMDELEEADRPEIRDAVSIARDELDIHDAEPGGFRIFEDEHAAATHAGAPTVMAACKSTYPQWYKDLTTAREDVTALKRKQVDARLIDIEMGKLPTKRTEQSYFAVMVSIKDLPQTSPLGRGWS